MEKPPVASAVDWTAYREEFPVTRRWAYLDHAAVAPLSRPARDAALAWVADQTENGDVHESRWMQRIEEARDSAAALLGAEPNEIAFVKNTSEGLGLVAEGFSWKPGDNIVSAAEEFPANVYPWLNLADRGVTLKQVPYRDGRIWPEDVEAALDDRTRLVTISFVEFSSGFRNDLDRLAQICHNRGVLLVVDAIQGLGVLPIDVRKSPIDFLSADGHKWLTSPEGAAIFFIRSEHLERLRTIGVGWKSVARHADYYTLDFRLKPSAARWESGSLNMPGVLGLGASVELFLGIGIHRIAERVLELTDYLCRRATEIGAAVRSSRLAMDRSGIVSLEIPPVNHRDLAFECRQAGIVVSHRGGRLRVSPHFYNTTDELDRLIEILMKAKNRGIVGAA